LFSFNGLYFVNMTILGGGGGGVISVSILFVMILGSYSGFHSFQGRRFLGLLLNMIKSDPQKNAHCMKNTWQHLEFF
jgi:hypothetical protein